MLRPQNEHYCYITNQKFQRNPKTLNFDFSGLQIYLRPGKVPFATGPKIRLARQMSDNKFYSKSLKHTSTHICRIKGCGGAGCPPPPIIFERLKLPQQIIYRRKENLSESPNHQKYWENILVSRFYEQFSRNRRNLGHFRKFEKISNS